MNADIERKITALLAQANHPNTASAEAQAFAAAAERLMLKYGIDESMLAAQSAGGIIVVDQILNVAGQYASTRMSLISALIAANRVKAVRLPGGNTVHLVGSKQAVENTVQMFTSLSLQMANHLRAAQPPSSVRGAALVSWRKMYLFGWVSMVSQRLVEQRKAAEADATVQHGPGMGLVLVTEKAAVDRRYREMFPNAGKARRSTVSGRFGGREAGRADGARASLGGASVGGSRGALGR